MRKGWIPVSGAAAMLLLSACDAGNMTAADPLSELDLNFSQALALQDSVVFRVTVSNLGDSVVEVPLSGPDNWALDVEITTMDGLLVWRRLTGPAAFPGVAIILGPGEAFELTASWDLRAQDGELVPPGIYNIRAFLITENATRREASPARVYVLPDPRRPAS